MKESTMEQTVRVKLTTEQLATYADTMSIKALAIEALREKKKRDAAATQADIDQLLDELNAIAKVVQEGEEERAQRDLFSQEQAASALTDLAKRVCSAADALHCEVHGDCTCPQPEMVMPPLRCALITECTAPATCLGRSSDSDSPDLSPGCDDHCGHTQTELGTCRPVTAEDQPKPPITIAAPEVKAVDCPLHGVENQHAKAVEPAPEAAPASEEPHGKGGDGADDEPAPADYAAAVAGAPSPDQAVPTEPPSPSPEPAGEAIDPDMPF